MIEAEQSVVIDTSIDSVWGYVQDIRGWANLFPGCKECTVIDENRSNWTIKVGAGGLVKTVNVLVHVDEWSGPERVNFSYKLEKEPVVGGGSYEAIRKSDGVTEISLRVRVEGSGPMAPMWEAVSKPLLPQMTKLFTGKLKTEIEALAGVTAANAPALSPVTRIAHWLRRVLRALFGWKTQKSERVS